MALLDTRETKIIELPSFPGKKVIVYTELLVWDQRQISSLEGDQFTKSLHGILKCIKSWDLEDEKWGIAEISIENLEMIKDKDLKVLLETISGKNFDDLILIWQQQVSPEKKN